MERDRLARLSLEREEKELSFDALRGAEKLADIVYLEVNGKLYGIVTLGDLLRARTGGLDRVAVNTRFACVRRDEYIRAREVFREKSGIHQLPVVDGDGRLEGAFSRYDDLLFLKYWDNWERNRFAARYLERHRNLALVKPEAARGERQRQFERWCERLAGYGCRVDRIDPWEAGEAFRDHDLVLYTDEEERRGAQARLLLEGKPYVSDRAATYCDLIRAMNEPPADILLRDLKDRGVRVIMLSDQGRGTEYQRKLYEGFEERRKRIQGDPAHVYPDEAEAFYGELYTEEYARAVDTHMFLMEKQNSFTRLKDCEEPYFHIHNGERDTVGQPERGRSIYFFGPCIAVGAYVEDRHTIESQLQELLNREGYPYRVVNCGCWENAYSELIRITSTPMNEGDVAVIFYRGKAYEGLEQINILDVLEENRVPGEWMLDSPVHLNHKANGILAREIFGRLVTGGLSRELPEGDRGMPGKAQLTVSEKAIRYLYVDRYYWNLPPAPGKRVGNISMHANPFTLGHKYLIDYARSRTDRLILMLIEEEMGIFSFSERYAMTCEALKGEKDVVIAPSGPFQATRAVFPGYFVKTDTSFAQSAENDCRIFAEQIAPMLGMNVRFFGDERHNPKMQEFNEIACRVLREYGVDAVVIPRAEKNGQAISASAVRKLQPTQRDELLQNVPESTLEIMEGVSF